MGNKMARRLRDLGFPVTVWNRDGQKSSPLLDVSCFCPICQGYEGSWFYAEFSAIVIVRLLLIGHIDPFRPRHPTTRC
jgi:3-hydroxyisobutyrate dehydrogenase